MSNDAPPIPSGPPAQPKTQSTGTRVFMIICGVIIMLGGLAKCVSGINSLMSVGAEKQLLTDSDKAIDKANHDVTDAQTNFMALLNDVDSIGLPAVRAKDKERAQKTTETLASASESFHLAAAKLEEAIQKQKDSKLNPYFTEKIKSYNLFAQTADLNREIIRLVLDDSIPDLKALMPKITEVATRRDEAQAAALKTSADAEENAKKLK